MGKLLKYSIALILAGQFCFLYVLKEESLFPYNKKYDLFISYLKRASDPHEKQLRLAESKKEAKRTRGNQVITTLKFVEEKYYQAAFSKTYKLVLTRNAGIDDSDEDWIDAGLYLSIDYGMFVDNEVVYLLDRATRRDSYWNGLNSLYDHPVNSVHRKILGEEIF